MISSQPGTLCIEENPKLLRINSKATTGNTIISGFKVYTSENVPKGTLFINFLTQKGSRRSTKSQHTPNSDPREHEQLGVSVRNPRQQLQSTSYLKKLKKQFSEKQIKRQIDTVRGLKRNPERGFKMRKLDLESNHNKIFNDSSFANNLDCSSQLGFIILLCNKFYNTNVIYYSSHKSRSNFRCLLGYEVCAFPDSFQFSYNIKKDM